MEAANAGCAWVATTDAAAMDEPTAEMKFLRVDSKEMFCSCALSWMLSILATEDVWRVAVGANALAVERIARMTANASDGECMALRVSGFLSVGSTGGDIYAWAPCRRSFV